MPPATESDLSTWGLTMQWYAANMGGAVATTHFVIDTSRNSDGITSMAQYAAAPYSQSASVVATLASRNWCNPPDSGLGLRPTAATGALLDAYLWVKIPGQSDGQCDSAGGPQVIALLAFGPGGLASGRSHSERITRWCPASALGGALSRGAGFVVPVTSRSRLCCGPGEFSARIK